MNQENQNFKFPAIQALVPPGEDFDESGIVHGGGFVSIQHLHAIEEALSKGSGKYQPASSSGSGKGSSRIYPRYDSPEHPSNQGVGSMVGNRAAKLERGV